MDIIGVDENELAHYMTEEFVDEMDEDEMVVDEIETDGDDAGQMEDDTGCERLRSLLTDTDTVSNVNKDLDLHSPVVIDENDNPIEIVKVTQPEPESVICVSEVANLTEISSDEGFESRSEQSTAVANVELQKDESKKRRRSSSPDCMEFVDLTEQENKKTVAPKKKWMMAHDTLSSPENGQALVITEKDRYREQFINDAFFSLLPVTTLPPSYEGDRFECPSCGNQYTSEANFKVHEKKRVTYMRYECADCDRPIVFYNRCTLLSHLKAHGTRFCKDNLVVIEPIDSQRPAEEYKIVTSIGPATLTIAPLPPSPTPPPSATPTPPLSPTPIPIINAAYSLRPDDAQSEKSTRVLLRRVSDVGDETPHEEDPVITRNDPVITMDLCSDDEESSDSVPLGVFGRCAICYENVNLREHFRGDNKPTYPCCYCYIVSPTKCADQAHRQLHEQKFWKRLVCPDCGSTFATQDTLVHHMRTICYYDRAGTMYTCPKCELVLPDSDRFHRHLVLVHTTVFYRCNRCGNSVLNLNHWASHLKYHDGRAKYTLVYKCEACEVANSKQKFHNHLLYHTSTINGRRHGYECSKCPYLCFSLTRFYAHTKRCLSNKKEELNPLPNGDNQQLIDFLNWSASKIKANTLPMFITSCPVSVITSLASVIAPPQPVTSSTSSHAVATPVSVITSIAATPSPVGHQVSPSASNVAPSTMEVTPSRKSCAICRKQLVNSVECEPCADIMKALNASKIGDTRVIKCSICGLEHDSSFIAEHYKTVHKVDLMQHTNNKPSARKRKSNSDLEPLSFPVLKQFPKSAKLDLVESKAPKVRKRGPISGIIQCGVCRLGFGSRTTFSQHIATHRSSFEHQCMECGQCFTQSSDLDSHLRGTHRIENLSFYHELNRQKECCEVCGAQYDTKFLLSKHMLVHGMVVVKKYSEANKMNAALK